MPTKGERVIATFEYVDFVLRCTSITLIPRKEPKIFLSSLYLASLFEEFDNQQNIIRLRINNKKKTFLLKKNNVSEFYEFIP